MLDLNLGTSQVVQLCRALERAPQITVLHLPHLGCGRDGLHAISELIRQRPLVALNLTGSWGMRREDPQSSCAISAPSSSGISVGKLLSKDKTHVRILLIKALADPMGLGGFSGFSLPQCRGYTLGIGD